MHHKKSLWFRLSSIFLALMAAQFLTGCGGGGGGTGVNTPVGPAPDGKTMIDGYVSYNATSSLVRAKVAGASFQPLKGAVIELIAFDDKGQEQVLGKTSTDANGYYRLAEVVNPHGWRNLIIRALAAGFELEGVLPQFLPGAIQHAQTLDSTTGLGARVIRYAAQLGQVGKVNLAELYALLPEAALTRLSDTALKAVVSGVIAREAVRKLTLGNLADQLMAYAFDLQTQLQTSIEAGEITAAEAWDVFARKMALKAEELGVKPEQMKALDDADQALVYEPGITAVSSAGSSDAELEQAALSRYRERKLRLLDSVLEAVKQLSPATNVLESFSNLIDTLKRRAEEARTPAELHRLFQNESSLLLKFSELIAQVMYNAGFSIEMIKECFQVTVPEFGFSDGSEASLRATSVAYDSGADPAGVAEGFIQKQEQFIAALSAIVQRVALAHNRKLTDGKVKAIALLIWVGSSENLNFALPLPTENPDPVQVPFSMTGTVTRLELPKQLDGKAFEYALQAQAVERYSEDGNAYSPGVPAIIAYLGESDPIVLTKLAHDGTKSESRATLADCVGAGLVEVQGKLATIPWEFDDPMPLLPDDDVIGLDVNDDSGSTSPGDAGSGIIDIAPIDPAHPTPWSADPLYVTVKRVTILPPPPPVPMRIDGALGRLAPVTSGGTTIAGVYVFKADDTTSPCHDAVAKFAMRWMENDEFPVFSSWIGKPVKASGILYDPDSANAPRQFLIQDISLRE